ncbi:MAG TPA: sporulation integral membrane protein YlbJ [Negativicutes bacterium]|nr:sporulation integral membrane protein YlbJ [Negativicutes bacterium]
MKKNNLPTFIYSIIFCIFVAFIVIYPQEAFNSAKDGLLLWFNIVCPSLLPFFICVEILIGLGIVSLFGSAFRPLMGPLFNVPGEGSFSFFMSIASGYPVGARITSRLRQEKLCTQPEGQRLLSLCSTSGPLFIIGAVATGIMNNPALGLLLASAHYLSAITIGLVMSFYGGKAPQPHSGSSLNPVADMLAYRKKDGRPFGTLLGDAVKNSVNLILLIGGFIILFSVATRMLKISGLLSFLALLLSRAVPFGVLSPETASSLLVGIMEVTNGVKECASLQVPLIYKAAVASFMIGFGGLSVNAQVLSIMSETDLKFGIYFIGKLLQGIAASIFSILIFLFCSDLEVFRVITPAAPLVWNPGFNISWKHTILSTFVHLSVVLLFMTAVSLASIKKRLLISKPFL